MTGAFQVRTFFAGIGLGLAFGIFLAVSLMEEGLDPRSGVWKLMKWAALVVMAIGCGWLAWRGRKRRVGEA